MKLEVQRLILEVIALMRPLVARIRRQDRKLAGQLGDAANSMVLNTGEAEYSDPGTRRSRFHSAAGSAGEVRPGLRAAVTWGYLAPEQARPADDKLDVVLAIFWRLTH